MGQATRQVKQRRGLRRVEQRSRLRHAFRDISGGGGAGPAEGTRQVVEAPVQGTVVQVPGGVGDTVADGSPLVVLESMKMEYPLKAPLAARVERVGFSVGSRVDRGDVLFELTPEED